MTIIYGLRAKGDSEIRYVGMTNLTLARRFQQHKSKANGKWHYQPAPWMREVGEVEIVQLRVCPKHIARDAERQWVLRLANEGHRLTNSKLMPQARAA